MRQLACSPLLVLEKFLLSMLSAARKFAWSSAGPQATRPRAMSEKADELVAVRHVANDKYSVGYSGIGFKTAGVRAVALALADGAECYDTSAETTYAGKYPFARYLHVYLNKKPNPALDSLRAEFIKYIRSKDGQSETELGDTIRSPPRIGKKTKNCWVWLRLSGNNLAVMPHV
jgi:ABC-type phosphate transport system substrate-binding protein